MMRALILTAVAAVVAAALTTWWLIEHLQLQMSMSGLA